MAPIPRTRPWMGEKIFTSMVFLLLCSAPYGVFAAASKKGVEHLAERGPVVNLADGNFTRYAEGKSRPYHIVLLFTAMSRSGSYDCASCRLVDIPFVKAAEAYAAQYNILEDENRIVFARVDIDKSRATFHKYSVSTAPHVYVIPMGKTIPSSQSALIDLEITQGILRPDGNMDQYLDDLARLTGIKVTILPDTSGLLGGALLIGVALGVIAHYLARVPSRVVAFVRSRGLWFVVSMACYLTGVGGMIFCIIRNPKTHGYDQRVGTVMFSPGSRDQFWYEGAVVALLYVGMSSAILGVYAAVGWKRVPSMARGAAVVICVTLLCYLSMEYLKLYMGKTMWYSLSQMLPPALGDLHAGPLKRKHGLLKRLVRLSHLWLNEYTTLEAFRGKLKTLLWDYLVRNVKASLGLSS